jgi:hypothetical protein
MTDAEAIKKWQEHWPFERASQELIKRIQRIQRINNTAAKKFDALIEEVGEAP